MKNENQINGTPPALWHSGSTSSPLSSRFNFDEKKLAEMQRHEFNIFPSPPGQHILYDKRQKNELTGAGLTSCSSPPSTLLYNQNIHDSHLPMGLYPSQQEHAASIHETNSTRNYTLPSPTTIYPTPPPSAFLYGHSHWFNDTF